MKKAALLITACVLTFPFVFANAGGNDCSIVGSWKFDIGGGHMASVEYTAGGRFVQKMGKLVIDGTYTLNGKTIRAVANGRPMIFSILSCSDTAMTVRRMMDGKTLLYTKDR